MTKRQREMYVLTFQERRLLRELRRDVKLLWRGLSQNRKAPDTVKLIERLIEQVAEPKC